MTPLTYYRPFGVAMAWPKTLRLEATCALLGGIITGNGQCRKYISKVPLSLVNKHERGLADKSCTMLREKQSGNVRGGQLLNCIISKLLGIFKLRVESLGTGCQADIDQPQNMLNKCSVQHC